MMDSRFALAKRQAIAKRKHDRSLSVRRAGCEHESQTRLFFRRFHDVGMGHVCPPSVPPGEAGVAGVDADEAAVLGADVDSPIVNGGLRSDRRAGLVGFGYAALGGIELQHLAFARG